MKKWIISIVLCISLLGLPVTPQVVSQAMQETPPACIEIGNVAKTVLQNAISEILMLIMYDSTLITVTNNLEYKIIFNLNALLEKEGYTMEDIAICIHNHYWSRRFSENDKKTYYHMKSQGFKGSFGIYVQAANTIIYMKADNEDKKTIKKLW